MTNFVFIVCLDCSLLFSFFRVERSTLSWHRTTFHHHDHQYLGQRILQRRWRHSDTIIAEPLMPQKEVEESCLGHRLEARTHDWTTNSFSKFWSRQTWCSQTQHRDFQVWYLKHWEACRFGYDSTILPHIIVKLMLSSLAIPVLRLLGAVHNVYNR